MPANAETFLNLTNNSRIPLASARGSVFNTGANASIGLVPSPGNTAHSPPQYLGSDGVWHDFSDWVPYTPSVRASAGAFTTVSASGAYAVIGAMTFFRFTVGITNTGTGTYPIVGLPNTLAGGVAIGFGREFAITGKALIATLSTNTEALVTDYANAQPNSSGAQISIQGFYQSAQT